ncbi:MAG: DUF4160 domain-containing protein [Bacteroidetes bacterium]|nr:DUF4160 domain-containing protein [Bacteroidota bacterium]
MTPLIETREGVSILIFSRDHLPPHLHACYGEEEALIEIESGKVIAGYLTNRKLRVVQDWLNEKENRSIAEVNFFALNPHLKKKGK